MARSGCPLAATAAQPIEVVPALDGAFAGRGRRAQGAGMVNRADSHRGLSGVDAVRRDACAALRCLLARDWLLRPALGRIGDLNSTDCQAHCSDGATDYYVPHVLDSS